MSDDAVIASSTTGDTTTRADAAVRAYARAGGDRRLIVAAVVGFIAFNAGSTWLFGIAGRCGILHFASQFSGSGERFDWLVQGCTVPASVQQILLPDFLVMAGYWLMCTAILIGGWWRITAPALRRATWVLWLPTVAIACDAVEYVLLTVLMEKQPDGQFAYRGDGGLVNFLQMAVSSAKWLAVAAMAVAGLVSTAVWFTRRRATFPPRQEEVRTLDPPREDSPLVERMTRVLLVGMTVFVVAWVLGLFMTHCAIDSGRLGPAYCAPPPVPADYFYAPSVVFAVIGVACLAVGAVAPRRWAPLRAVWLVVVSASLFLAVWLVWTPAWFRSLDGAGVPGAVAGALIVVSAVAGVLAGPSHKRWAARALTALEVAGTVAWALVVMYAVATSATWSPATPWGTISLSATSRWSVIAAGAALVAVYVAHTARRPSPRTPSIAAR